MSWAVTGIVDRRRVHRRSVEYDTASAGCTSLTVASMEKLTTYYGDDAKYLCGPLSYVIRRILETPNRYMRTGTRSFASQHGNRILVDRFWNDGPVAGTWIW